MAYFIRHVRGKQPENKCFKTVNKGRKTTNMNYVREIQPVIIQQIDLDIICNDLNHEWQ